MKYIRKFNENSIEEIVTSFENLLLDLTDRGYKVIVRPNRCIDDSDLINIDISNGSKIHSDDIIEYIYTIADYLSNDYEYNISIYANGEEYNDIDDLCMFGCLSNRYIIYFNIKEYL